MDCNLPTRSYDSLKNKMETKMKIRPTRPKPTVEVRPLRPKTILLTPEEENELSEYIIELQKIVFRLTINDVIIIANQLAEKHNKKLKFRNNAIMAERLWVLDLMKRHPEIILRIPQINTNPGSFNMAEVDYFYKKLSEICDVKKIPPDRIYTTDYIDIFLGESSTYIINRKGNKHNRDGIIQAKVCFSADGHYIPTMIIFSQNHQLDLTKDEGDWRISIPNGSLTNDLFLQWFRRFIFFSGVKKEQQVFLLFDGQPMYTKNIEIVKITKDNGVNMISFPPCTQKKLQPIDDIFINDLSKAYKIVVDAWLQLNPENKLTPKHVADLFEETLLEEAAAIAAIESFKRCGIYPLDTNLFTESDFLPVVTNVQIYKEKTPPPSQTHAKTFNISTNRSNEYYFDVYYNPRPGCSFWPDW